MLFASYREPGSNPGKGENYTGILVFCYLKESIALAQQNFLIFVESLKFFYVLFIEEFLQIYLNFLQLNFQKVKVLLRRISTIQLSTTKPPRLDLNCFI